VSDDLAVLAADAFVYGFALVFNLQEVGRVSQEGLGSVAPAPFNPAHHQGPGLDRAASGADHREGSTGAACS